MSRAEIALFWCAARLVAVLVGAALAPPTVDAFARVGVDMVLALVAFVALCEERRRGKRSVFRHRRRGRR